MADLTFKRRYATDTRFQAAVENVQREAILRMAGLDPESLNEAWEEGLSPFTLETYEAWLDGQGAVETQEPAAGEDDDEDDEEGDLRVTSAAQALADDHDIDLTQVHGSGKHGRVTKGDVSAIIDGA